MTKQENFKQKFIQQCKERFGERLTYDKVNYVDMTTPVIITCIEHGDFSILPKSLKKSKWGCPICTKLNTIRKNSKLIDGQNRKSMREYRIWQALRSRATDPNRADAKYYYEKGITVDPSWDDFNVFYNDMGKCPENYTIDRIDPNGNYCKENCRWASMTTQSQNRGDFNEVYTYNGETHVLKEWSRILNIKYTTLYNRIHRSGKTFEEAIESDPFNRLIEFKGEKHTLKEWCKIKNMEYAVVMNRLSKHKWSFEDAITIPKGGRRIKI